MVDVCGCDCGGDFVGVGCVGGVLGAGESVVAKERAGALRARSGFLAALGMTISFRNCLRKAKAKAKAKAEAEAEAEAEAKAKAKAKAEAEAEAKAKAKAKAKAEAEAKCRGLSATHLRNKGVMLRSR